MDGVSSATNATVASQGLGSDIATAAELQTDFLNLLMAQLRHQDPLSPMDNEAMVQQLATFSQLEQLERVNSNLTQQMGYSQSLNNTMMMDVVGKRVTVLGNDVSIESGVPSRSIVRVPGAGEVHPRILDSNGDVVRTLDSLPVTPGFNKIEWDGRDDDGDVLPDGQYTLDVSATDRDGGFMALASFSSGLVDTVQFDDNFVYFEVNGIRYTPADVVEVSVATPTTSSSDDDGEVEEDDGFSADPPTTIDDPYTPPVDDPLARGASNLLGGSRSPWEALLRIR